MSLTEMIEITHEQAVGFACESELCFIWFSSDVKCPECDGFESVETLDPFVKQRAIAVGECMNRLEAVLDLGQFRESPKTKERSHAMCFQGQIAPEFRYTYLPDTHLPTERTPKSTTAAAEIVEWQDLKQRVLDRTVDVLNALYALRYVLERQHVAKLTELSIQNRKRQRVASKDSKNASDHAAATSPFVTAPMAIRC
jgi:hypothetical protein